METGEDTARPRPWGSYPRGGLRPRTAARPTSHSHAWLSLSWGPSRSPAPPRTAPPPPDARGCQTWPHPSPQIFWFVDAGMVRAGWLSEPVQAEGPTGLHPHAKSSQAVGTRTAHEKEKLGAPGQLKGREGHDPVAMSALGIGVAGGASSPCIGTGGSSPRLAPQVGNLMLTVF